MSDRDRAREPLGVIPTNTPLRHSLPHHASTSSSSISASPPSSAGPGPSTRKLAPIFTAKRQTPSPTTINQQWHQSTDPRKRPKLDSLVFEPSAFPAASDATGLESAVRSHGRVSSIPEWFLPSTPASYDRVREGKRRAVHDEVDVEMAVVPTPAPGVWRRPRRRLGATSNSLQDMSRQRFTAPQDPYLSTLVTSIAPYNPMTPPSILLLPSLHPPTGRPREFAPALSVAFNNVAKHWDEDEARDAGKRRLVAVAGEEGGVRIVDVDEGLGVHREEKGFWWRAHGNAIFDFKWSADDSRVLSASGDQSTRLHALTTPTPTLIATLRGHTSSVKTAVFFDPTRCHSDPSVASSVIATGGRDGNILIYDVRCQGRPSRDSESPSPSRSQSRDRYGSGVPGFAAQHSASCLDPVMVIKQAHGDGKRGAGRTSVRSVTSLVALQSMPGALASGGSYDGIVKLWDLRFTGATSRHPEGRSSCTAVGSLPDPTLQGTNPSRRPRSINALCEQPNTGDLFALCGDSKVHTLRPSAAASGEAETETEGDQKSDAILPPTFSDPKLLVSSFYIRLAVSPDGKRLAAGSCRGGVMTWDVSRQGQSQNQKQQKQATRLRLGPGGVIWPEGREREVCAVDWGKDMLAASSDDLATRIWRSDPVQARALKEDPEAAGEDWVGAV